MNYKITLTQEEKKHSLQETIEKIKRILYVYEKSLCEENYNYKSYVYGVLVYISSFNCLLDLKMTDVIINLNSLLINDFDKKEIKRIVLESKNIIEHIEV